MILKIKDILFIGGVSLVFLLISFAGWQVFGEIAIVISLGLFLIIVLTFQFETFRRIHNLQNKYYKKQSWNFRQIESLFSSFYLFYQLEINQPLPKMWHPAIRPDAANHLISIIKEKKPKCIVELGSGVSTLISAYCLKAIGGGKIISFEHEKKFADLTSIDLKKHNLDEIATVIYSPLKKVNINDNFWMWYDISLFNDIDSIDLLFIDGPPGNLQKMSRYPALPILFKYLSDDATILLDDGVRKDEKRIVKAWTKEFDCLEAHFLKTEREVVLLEKIKKM